jgi:hypothetical protein
MSRERGGPRRAAADRHSLGARTFIIIGLLSGFAALQALTPAGSAQKGTAESDWYPVGYTGDTWAGEVTAFDNDQRTLTLSHGSGKNAATFVASIPDAPYQWRRNARKARVIDFPYDKTAPAQNYVYRGTGFAADFVPEGTEGEVRVPNPPASDVITDFSQFKGRKVMVFYTTREREVNGQKVKYNDVWRIQVMDKK